jgi:hypothetical protein
MNTNDDSEGQRAMFYLSLGIVSGSLMERSRFEALVQALRAGDINPAYVLLVREKLSRALEAAGTATPDGDVLVPKHSPLFSTRADASRYRWLVERRVEVRYTKRADEEVTHAEVHDGTHWVRRAGLDEAVDVAMRIEP